MNKNRMMIGVRLAIVGVMVLSAMSSAQAEDQVNSVTGVAQSSGLMLEAGKPDRLNFTFGGQVTAWLSPSGEWRLEGNIPHSGLLCGTYQVGLRFGVGNPGCTDVQWLTEDPSYVTRELQCNNASAFHSGGDSQPALAENYARISCAERLILCSGTCK